jgi:hypothetical protein
VALYPLFKYFEILRKGRLFQILFSADLASFRFWCIAAVFLSLMGAYFALEVAICFARKCILVVRGSKKLAPFKERAEK